MRRLRAYLRRSEEINQPTIPGIGRRRTRGSTRHVKVSVMNIFAENGIGYDDYMRGMHTDRRALTTYRKGGVPLWLYDMAKIRLVLCQVVWDWIFNSRAGGVPPLLRNSLVEL